MVHVQHFCVMTLCFLQFWTVSWLDALTLIQSKTIQVLFFLFFVMIIFHLSSLPHLSPPLPLLTAKSCLSVACSLPLAPSLSPSSLCPFLYFCILHIPLVSHNVSCIEQHQNAHVAKHWNAQIEGGRKKKRRKCVNPPQGTSEWWAPPLSEVLGLPVTCTLSGANTLPLCTP